MAVRPVASHASIVLEGSYVAKYHSSSILPMESVGLLLVVMSISFLISGAYFLVISAFESMRLRPFPFLDAIVNDTHYKYLILLLVPTTSYFVIANWVGWQYFRNA